MANYVLRKTALDNCEDVAFSADTIKSVEKNFNMNEWLSNVTKPLQGECFVK